jgi:hypothetical protein
MGKVSTVIEREQKHAYERDAMKGESCLRRVGN